ncbi:MAG: hypothetical protein KDJ37_12110 [Hyphomicrobiaceae bacterium]|nr:hypothetical protein [Hyphomicrobiaceae bacterium]
MNKIILTIAAALTIATVSFTTSAQAGGCGGYGRSYSSYSSYSSQSYERSSYNRRKASLRAAKASERRREIAQRRAEKREQVAAASTVNVSKPQKIAVALPTQKPETTKIAEAATATVNKAVTRVAEVAREIGCKRFIPSAGLTISVPCVE